MTPDLTPNCVKNDYKVKLFTSEIKVCKYVIPVMQTVYHYIQTLFRTSLLDLLFVAHFMLWQTITIIINIWGVVHENWKMLHSEPSSILRTSREPIYLSLIVHRGVSVSEVLMYHSTHKLTSKHAAE